MAEQRVDSLLDALEGRTRSLLERLARERGARCHAESVQAELAQRLGELERRLAEAQAARRECAEAQRGLEEAHRTLEEGRRRLEAQNRELKEECRELEKQNSELEAHNRHLHERLTSAQPAEGGFRPGRRSRGLSALIGETEKVALPPEAPTPQGASEPPSPQALLGEWYERYPAAFFKGHTRPLVVGIHAALARREPWPEKLVRRALACYVNLPRYLKAMREGAERIDLDGQPAGRVDTQAADHALRKLERLQSKRRAGQERDSQDRQHHGRGKSSGAADQGRGKPKKRANTTDPVVHKPEPVPAAPSATMEEKLSALMAKHNGR